MILGVSSFAYGWNVGVEGHLPATLMSEMDVVQKAVDFGLHCVQMGDNLPLHTLDDTALANLKDFLAENALRFEVGARGLTANHLETYLRIAEFFKAPLVRFVIDSGDYEPNDDEIVGIIKDFLPQLLRQNCTLGIENHDRFKAKELANIMRRIDDEKVGICLDCANSLGAGEGLDWVTKQLAPYTVNLHIKDFTVERLPYKMGFTVLGRPAGKGMMNLAWMLTELARYRGCQSAILELWTPPEATPEATVLKENKWAEESIAYLKNTFAQSFKM